MSVVFGLADVITVLVYGEVIASTRRPRSAATRAVQEAYLGTVGRMMLEVRDLHAYYGKSHILQGVDLAVGEGEIVSLLGRNGVGRSTTCKAIMGLVPPRRAGHASRAGRSPGCGPTRSPMPGIGYVPEDRQVFPGLTVRQNLELGLKRAGAFGRWTFDDIFSPVPQPRRAARQSGRRAVGRRAADAHHVPHPDGRSRPRHHRRADRGSGPQAGRAGRPAARRDRPARRRRSCWSSRSSPSRSRSRTGSTSWAMAASCSRARRPSWRPMRQSARNGSKSELLGRGSPEPLIGCCRLSEERLWRAAPGATAP